VLASLGDGTCRPSSLATRACSGVGGIREEAAWLGVVCSVGLWRGVRDGEGSGNVGERKSRGGKDGGKFCRMLESFRNDL
jgi:hypothetical protein